jgi:hypothetical protein
MLDTSLLISAERSAGEARRVAIASAIGTTIEWYDFFIYGTAAAGRGLRTAVLPPRL